MRYPIQRFVLEFEFKGSGETDLYLGLVGSYGRVPDKGIVFRIEDNAGKAFVLIQPYVYFVL